MVEQGASIIDVGGESTRPGANEVSDQEQLDRVLPVITAIAAQVDVAISIDTSSPVVMRTAAEAGVFMINDVFALRRDGALNAAAETSCAICLMHMQGEPRAMQDNPVYDDVIDEVGTFLCDRVTTCIDNGIGMERIVVDPGFGFGKTDRHNIELLANLDRLQVRGLPILVGLSRKRTLGNLTGRDVENRLAAGIAAAVIAFERGATIIRTHDIAATADALKIAMAVREAQNV
jgi:dihydropteroate synthase